MSDPISEKTGLATYLSRNWGVISAQHAEWRKRGLTIKVFWDGIAAAIAADNVVGKRNEVPNGNMVRKAWDRLERNRWAVARSARNVPEPDRRDDVPEGETAPVFGRTRKL
jgi:hypothetical protein